MYIGTNMCICHCVAVDHVHITIAVVRWMADWLFGGWRRLFCVMIFCLDIGRLCSLLYKNNFIRFKFESFNKHKPSCLIFKERAHLIPFVTFASFIAFKFFHKSQNLELYINEHLHTFINTIYIHISNPTSHI